MTEIRSEPIDSVNLRWLVRVRWVGYLGALGLAASLHQLTRVQFDQTSAIFVAGVGLSSNVLGYAAWWRARARRGVLLLLLIDAVLLTLLALATGGPASPFVLGYVLLLAIASVLVSRRALWALCVLVFVALLLTAFARLPVFVDHTHEQGQAGHHPGHLVHSTAQHLWLHVRELWLATLVLIVLVVYVVRWALEQRERELDELRGEVERSARLAELWSLAASAAHELGTPLATISVIANELQRRAKSSDWGERTNGDLVVICKQLERCREVLGNMANEARSEGREPSVELSLERFIDEACARVEAPERLQIELSPGGASSRAVVPLRLLLSVVQSLIDNALEAAPSPAAVRLEAASTEHDWTIRVTDQGPGLSPKDLRRAGRVPFSTKSDGMGVGLFLSRTIMDRLGGSLQLASTDAGTTVRLTLPRHGTKNPTPDVGTAPDDAVAH